MKKLIFTLLAATTFSSVVAATSAISQKADAVTIFKAPATEPAKSEAEVFSVILDVDYDLPLYQELSGLFAIESSGTDLQLYYGLSEEEDSHIYEFTLPGGSYDFYVGAMLGDYEGMLALTIDNVEVTGNMNLNIKASSAIYRTDIKHIAPDGSELRMLYDQPRGNCPSAQFIQSLMHNGELILMNSLSTDGSAFNYILTNSKNSNYSISRLDMMHSPFGYLNMIIPIDFNQTEVSTDVAGWQFATHTFAQTPANEKLAEFYASTGNPDYYYGFSPTLLMVNERTSGVAGIGMFDPACSTATVGVWAPENYNGPYDLWPMATGATISGWSSCTSSLPLKRTENGLRQVGVNILPDRLIYLRDESSPLVGEGYAPFTGEIPQVALGNCTPMLILTPEEEYFEFTFTGRHGEAMSQASNYYAIPSIEYWDNIFGSPLCDLKFYRNNELICADRIDFPYDTEWDEPADYRLEISTDNVLIDGQTPGFVKTIHTFGQESSNMMPPTLTSLRIVDARGNINDRLEDFNNAKVIFTGGHFYYNDDYAEKYVYASFEEVECVSAEYAPRGSEDFISLTVEKAEEPVMPGYGSLFSADLSGITVESPDGWYDLRITIQDAEGGTQTQYLSPAFRLESAGGIGNLNSSAENIDLFSPLTRIFSIDGKQINASDLGKGLYIINTPEGSFKKVF